MLYMVLLQKLSHHMEKFLRYIVVILLIFLGIESVGIILMLQSLYRMERHVERLHKAMGNSTSLK